MTGARRLARPVLSGLVLVLGAGLLAGCGEDGPGTVTVTVAGQRTELSPIMLCADGSPKVYGEDNGVNPLQVDPGQRIRITVSDAIADKSWKIQVWSATRQNGTLVPAQAIQVLDAGKATSYDKLTTSDAVPDSIYLFVTTPPEGNCKDAGGLWPVALVRTPAGGDAPASGSTSSGAASPSS